MSLQLPPALRTLGVVLGGFVLLVLGSLTAYSGLRSLAQAGAPAPPAVANPMRDNNARPDVVIQHARLLAAQSQGNWMRLSADDQQQLNSVTGGHGREMLRSLALGQAAKKPHAAKNSR